MLMLWLKIELNEMGKAFKNLKTSFLGSNSWFEYQCCTYIHTILGERIQIQGTL